MGILFCLPLSLCGSVSMKYYPFKLQDAWPHRNCSTEGGQHCTEIMSIACSSCLCNTEQYSCLSTVQSKTIFCFTLSYEQATFACWLLSGFNIRLTPHSLFPVSCFCFLSADTEADSTVQLKSNWLLRKSICDSQIIGTH